MGYRVQKENTKRKKDNTLRGVVRLSNYFLAILPTVKMNTMRKEIGWLNPAEAKINATPYAPETHIRERINPKSPLRANDSESDIPMGSHQKGKTHLEPKAGQQRSRCKISTSDSIEEEENANCKKKTNVSGQ